MTFCFSSGLKIASFAYNAKADSFFSAKSNIDSKISFVKSVKKEQALEVETLDYYSYPKFRECWKLASCGESIFVGSKNGNLKGKGVLCTACLLLIHDGVSDSFFLAIGPRDYSLYVLIFKAKLQRSVA